MRRERGDECDVAIGPVARLARARRQRPDDAVVMGQWRDEVAGELERCRRSARRPRAGRSGRPARPWTRPVRRTSPTQPSQRRASAAPRRRRRSSPAQAASVEEIVADQTGSSRSRRAAPASSRRRSFGTAPGDRATRRASRRCRGHCRAARQARIRGLRGRARMRPCRLQRTRPYADRRHDLGGEHPTRGVRQQHRGVAHALTSGGWSHPSGPGTPLASGTGDGAEVVLGGCPYLPRIPRRRLVLATAPGPAGPAHGRQSRLLLHVSRLTANGPWKPTSGGRLQHGTFQIADELAFLRQS